jgi:hypothetical protein
MRWAEEVSASTSLRQAPLTFTWWWAEEGSALTFDTWTPAEQGSARRERFTGHMGGGKDGGLMFLGVLMSRACSPRLRQRGGVDRLAGGYKGGRHLRQ